MATRKAGMKKARFTLWLPEDTIEDLQKLQQELGKVSVAEVVREALEVYSSVRLARKRGVNLYFEDTKTGEKGRIWLLPGPPPVG